MEQGTESKKRYEDEWADHGHDLGQIRNAKSNFTSKSLALKNRRAIRYWQRELSRGDSLTLFSIGVSWTFN